MGIRITQEEFEKRVNEVTHGKYTILGQYVSKDKPILARCNIHNIEVEIGRAKSLMYEKEYNDNGYCPKCKEEFLNRNAVKLECAYCHKEFYRSPSKLLKSRSGLYFCNKECKLAAQRLESGKQFSEMRPLHYGTADSEYTYRRKAFRSYSHCCAICNWDEDEEILQVHHIDEDRQNNELTNLIILCPNCHAKLTSHKYQLIDRSIIEKL